MNSSSQVVDAELDAIASTSKERHGDRVQCYLHPGQVHVTAVPSAVTTVLGSCVTVTLWDRVQKVGGLTHFVLPHEVGPTLRSCRYGAVAVATLLADMKARHCRHGDMEAKLFGGANIIGTAKEPFDEQLGFRNVELARRLLEEASLPVVSENVGGRRGRKLIFYTDAGSAWVKTL